jgi:hypothetical protein
MSERMSVSTGTLGDDITGSATNPEAKDCTWPTVDATTTMPATSAVRTRHHAATGIFFSPDGWSSELVKYRDKRDCVDACFCIVG